MKNRFPAPGQTPNQQRPFLKTTGLSRQIVPGDGARTERRGPGVPRLEAAEFVPTQRRLKDTKQFVVNSVLSFFINEFPHYRI
jgi:hypothetical protein